MGVEAVKAIVQHEESLPQAKLLASYAQRIHVKDLSKALKNGRGIPWSEEARMENAKDLWGYQEIRRLFDTVSYYAAPAEARAQEPS